MKSVAQQRGPHVVAASYLHKTPRQSVNRHILTLLIVSKDIAALSTGSHSDPHGPLFCFLTFGGLVAL